MTSAALCAISFLLLCIPSPFESRALFPTGIDPGSFLVSTVLVRPDGMLVCLLSRHDIDGSDRAEIWLASVTPERFRFERRLYAQKGKELPSYLLEFDVDGDGVMELLAYGDSADSHSCLSWGDDGLQQRALPYQPLDYASMLVVDTNRDGTLELVVAGHEPVDPKDRARQLVLIYEVADGELRLLKSMPDFPGIDSLASADIDGDGWNEIVVFPPTGWVSCPTFTTLYSTETGEPTRIEQPVLGLDEIVGLSGGAVAVGDFDDDASVEIVFTGIWSGQIGRKAYLGIAYERVDGAAGFHLQYDHEMTARLPDVFGRISAWDADGDGDLDLLISGLLRDGGRSVLLVENTPGSIAEALIPSKRLWEGAGYSTVVVPCHVGDDDLMDILCFPSVSHRPILLLQNRATPIR